MADNNYFAPKPSVGKMAAVGSVVVAAGAATVYLVRRAYGSDSESPPPPPGEQPPPPAPAPAPANLGPQFAPDLQSTWWGNIPVEWRASIKQWTDLAKIPYLWAFFAVVMRREASYTVTAHNDSAGETAASAAAIAAGAKRGNPTPKFANDLAAFGSGGLFGGLAPYVAWIGMDEKYMPFLNRKATISFNANAAAVFACHYAWRILAKYTVRHWMDVRTGWASPSVLKSSPDGTTAAAVRARMFEDMTALNILWLANAPATAGNYPGINVVAPALGFTNQQAD